MPYRIFVSPVAIIDIEEATHYYNGIRPILGERFVAHTNARIERLAITPKSGSICYEDIRSVAIEKFPYILYYAVTDPTYKVTVYRLLHASQKPIWSNF